MIHDHRFISLMGRRAVPALTLLFVLLSLRAEPQADVLPSRAEAVVDYTIQARLDPATHVVTGRQRLVWRNPSNEPVAELWFHLYLNAFRDKHSTFYRESGGQLRGDYMPDEGWGHINVTSMKTVDGVDVLPRLRFEAPDDGNRRDATVARVPLPAPVPGSGTITLDIDFTSALPKVFARTGYDGDYHLVAQWYPKIAVYEPAGMRGRTTGAWNAHQFHANTEFYADFGRFDVSVTVPSRFVVGATGERQSATPHPDGTTTYRYVQENVHDFAWTADPKFVVREARFSATQDVSMQEYAAAARLLDRPASDLQLRDVSIRLLIQPEHLPQAQRYLDAAKLAIKRCGLLYGAYPYAVLTIVDPAPGAGGSGGMEYPTFITGGTSFLMNRGPLRGVRDVEAVTIHEFAHQYWYGLVASNEFEEAWLDEGFTSYSTGKISDEAYGADRSLVHIGGLTLGTVEGLRAQLATARQFERVRQPAWTFWTGAYSFYAYTKPQLILLTLERYLGADTMARVMRTYHERWRFRHPGSDDFYAVASEVSGQDLTWFFSQMVEGTEAVDYAVERVSTSRLDEHSGSQPDEDADADADTNRTNPGATDGQFESTVLVVRRGGVVFPVDVELLFDDGHAERVRWDGRERYTRIRRVTSRPLVSATVDPDGMLVLDVDARNNGRRVDADARIPVKWAMRWLTFVQQLAAFFGV